MKNQPKPASGKSNLELVLIPVILGFLGFGAYKYFKKEPAAPSNAEVAAVSPQTEIMSKKLIVSPKEAENIQKSPAAPQAMSFEEAQKIAETALQKRPEQKKEMREKILKLQQAGGTLPANLRAHRKGFDPARLRDQVPAKVIVAKTVSMMGLSPAQGAALLKAEEQAQKEYREAMEEILSSTQDPKEIFAMMRKQVSVISSNHMKWIEENFGKDVAQTYQKNRVGSQAPRTADVGTQTGQ